MGSRALYVCFVHTRCVVIIMALLSVQNVTMDFAGDVLFRDVCFEIQPKQKLGFIGANGAGKTTLFKIILEQLEATAGSVTRARGCTLGYLQQHACADSQKNVYEELLEVFAPLMQLEKELAAVAAQIETGTADLTAAVEKQHSLQSRFEQGGGLTYQSRARAALLGLGFSQAELIQSCASLSGGQRSKLSLCKLLLSGADLLLLDEPTNHLDIAGVEWLESFIQTYKGACILISHDRYFLDQTTTHTLRLSHGKLTVWEGNYSAYLIKKQERDEILKKRYANDQKEVRRLEGIVEQQRRWQHFVTAEHKQKMLDRKLSELEKPEGDEKTLSFAFRPVAVSGNEVLNVTQLAKSFGEKKLFAKADLQLRRGERACLLGPNGCGKTTFLRILAGQQQADAGSFAFGAKVSAGYFDQSLEGLHNEKTVLDEIWDSHRDYTETMVRGALAIFLFQGDDVYKKVEKLSGGEKAKLALLKLMLSGANLLLLDEPTNHLDIPSREALEKALLQFSGTMLIVSHDRYFIAKLQTKIIRMAAADSEESGFQQYLYGYAQYAEAMRLAQTQQKQTEKPQKENSYRQRKERESELRKLQTRLSRCETRIAQLEKEEVQVAAQLAEPENAADYEKLLDLSAHTQQLREELEALLGEWEDLHEQIEKHTQ